MSDALTVNPNVSDLYTVAGSGRLVRRERMAAPHLSVDAHLTTPSVEVNVRSFTLAHSLDAVFRPSLGYLDLSLDSRERGACGAFRGDAGQTAFGRLGQSVLVPAGQTFHVRCESMQRRVVCCMFETARFDQLRDWQWDAARLDLCRDLRVTQVRDAMLQLAGEAISPGFASAALAESLLMSMLVQIARHVRGADPRGNEGEGSKLAPWQLRLIRERVEGACGPSPGVIELAQACRISARHLSRTFRNSTGMTLSAFIADARIRQAKARLADADVLVKTVAYECGFANAAAFGAAFRKVTGRTPRAYRLDMLGLQTAPEHDMSVRR
ncbi:helix-turn-helix domain-containing protein [Paraburkholderia aromaticivorans]|uniref:helix-turn-helix domain-containing protein n=1 Tax=Paraburkholderia aromaticivorans TaxID=2026199 RepID=UPI001455F406|nr:helix-turn-helix domain-containing protein [Paraburkholderia aromaticivorans]